jgi:uncharacterized protein YndB with AHSA1/START domain
MENLMVGSTFSYEIHIRATPEQLWMALTDASLMKQYWFGRYIDADWAAGSPWMLRFPDGGPADGGQIVEFDPLRRIVLNWRNEWRQDLSAEGDTRCVIDLQPHGRAVRLTLTHVSDCPESKFIGVASARWPLVLSSLKSLLETGVALSE